MITIQQKIEEIQAELQVIVDKYNQAAETKNTLFNRINELQGGLKVLQELNVDIPADTEST